MIISPEVRPAAEDCQCGFRAAGAGKAGERGDLAGASGEADVVEEHSACRANAIGEVVYFKDGAAGRGRSAIEVFAGQLAADHSEDQFVGRGVIDIECSLPAAVFEHCYAIGDLKHFFQAV